MAATQFTVQIPSPVYERELRRQEMEEFLRSVKVVRSDEKRPVTNGAGGKVQVKPVSVPTIRFFAFDGTEFVDSGGPVGEPASVVKEPVNPNLLTVPSTSGTREKPAPKKRKTPREELAEKLALDGSSTMVDILRRVTEVMGVQNVAWIETNEGRGLQVTFWLESGPECDDVIYLLSCWGVGQRFDSSIAFNQCTLFRTGSSPADSDGDDGKKIKKGLSVWNKMLSSMRARFSVAHVVEQVGLESLLTYDFVSMLLVASIVAVYGLVDNSLASLIGSMLFSPLMSPVHAISFGVVVKKRPLLRVGLRNTAISILLTVAVGLIVGLHMFIFDALFGRILAITPKMLSLCKPMSLIAAFGVAFCSGAAVGLAILGGNTGSIVGAAISTSLLPPAINTGLLWSVACLHLLEPLLGVHPYARVETPVYSDNQSLELFVLGLVSLAQTLVNVICIFLGGFVFLKLKKVTAVMPNDQEQHWKHHRQLSRESACDGAIESEPELAIRSVDTDDPTLPENDSLRHGTRQCRSLKLSKPKRTSTPAEPMASTSTTNIAEEASDGNKLRRWAGKWSLADESED